MPTGFPSYIVQVERRIYNRPAQLMIIYKTQKYQIKWWSTNESL